MKDRHYASSINGAIKIEETKYNDQVLLESKSGEVTDDLTSLLDAAHF